MLRRALLALCFAVTLLLLRAKRAATEMSKLYVTKDPRMRRIIAKCAGTAVEETYRAPLFCCNTWVNVMVMLCKERWLSGTTQMRRDTLWQPDGGEVSVDWADDAVTRALPPDAPILGILHTIAGNSAMQNGNIPEPNAPPSPSLTRQVSCSTPPHEDGDPVS